MNFLDIAKTVGTGLFSQLVPGGSAILGVVNELLPDDKKLPVNATGAEVVDAVNQLPPELKAQVELKRFDVDIATIKAKHESIQTMLSTEAVSKHTTRPKIALGSFRVLAGSTLLTVLIWGYAVATGDTEMVQAVMNGWPFVVAITGTFTTLLYAYFGVLRDEKRDTLNASQGVPAGATGLLGKLSDKVLGKK